MITNIYTQLYNYKPHPLVSRLYILFTTHKKQKLHDLNTNNSKKFYYVVFSKQKSILLPYSLMFELAIVKHSLYLTRRLIQ